MDVDEHQKIKTEEKNKMEGKTYEVKPIRWLILFLFVMYSTSNAFQWTQLVIITNILEKYYNVPTLGEFISHVD